MTPRPSAESIHLRDMVGIALRGWPTVLVSTVLTVVLVTVWMAIVDPKYTAQMTIAPTGTDPSQNLGALSAVASFAGIGNMVSEDVPRYERFQQILFTRLLAERLDERHQIIRRVFEDLWDAETETWLPPPGPLNKIKATVNPWFGLPAWSDPSDEELVEFLKEEVAIAQVGDTAMLQLSFSHEDPAFASAVLNWLHAEADTLLREEAREQALQQVAYARERLASVTVSDYRTMMLSLLGEEEKKLLLIEGAGPYAALVVDPATSSDQPTFPKPVIFLVAAVILGGSVGLALVFAWHAFFAPIPRAVEVEVGTAAPVEQIKRKRGAG